jgi:hypothetical protein
MAPPHGQLHVDVNFVQPSPIQQLHTFEQLNTENQTHQWNNSKKKGKNETIITRDQEETTPNKTNLLGETRIEVTRTPNGTIKKNAKGRKTTKTLGKTSLALFAVSMDIILTTAPKFLTSNR